MIKKTIYKCQELDLKLKLSSLLNLIMEIKDAKKLEEINNKIDEIRLFLQDHTVISHPASDEIVTGSLFSFSLGNKVFPLACLINTNHLEYIDSPQISPVFTSSKLGNEIIGRKKGQSFSFQDGKKFLRLEILDVYLNPQEKLPILETTKTFKKTA